MLGDNISDGKVQQRMYIDFVKGPSPPTIEHVVRSQIMFTHILCVSACALLVYVAIVSWRRFRCRAMATPPAREAVEDTLGSAFESCPRRAATTAGGEAGPGGGAFQSVGSPKRGAASGSQDVAQARGMGLSDIATSRFEAFEGASTARSDQNTTPELPRIAALAVLGLITIVWGLQHPTIKFAIDGTDEVEAALLNLLRFFLATMCFLMFLPRPRTPGGSLVLEWRGGSELGLWLFCGFALQAVGLLYTTAQRGAVLLYLNVKFVPFFARVFFSRPVPCSVWVSAVVALIGVILVCLGSGDSTGNVSLNVGDVICLVAAAASGMFILRLENFANVTDPSALNAVCMLIVFTLCIPWVLMTALCKGMLLSEVGRLIVGLCENQGSIVLYLGVVTTAVMTFLQTIVQQSVPATHAVIIYSLDVVWGCIFSYLILGEVLRLGGIVGASLVIAASVYQGIFITRNTDSADLLA